jgi:hypothetical protein
MRGHLGGTVMRKISLRRLLSKLAVIALATSPALASPDDRVTPDPSLSGPEAGELGSMTRGLIAEEFIDRGNVDARDAAALLGRGLAIALERFKPIEATQVASSWALSPDPLRRIGVARALEWSFPLVGDALVIEHLSHDPDPQIRAACARAAWIRRATGGDLGVLDRLARDPDPEVAAIALWPR